jgi:outer membrane protein OmpA-like peptidoglycan-associated protein
MSMDMEPAMRASTFAIIAFASLFSCGAALSQTAYTSDQLVKRFMEQKQQGHDLQLGASRSIGLGRARGLCVGTEQECRSQASATRPAGIDLVVTFDLNSDRLTPDARRNLDEFAKALADPRLAKFTFEVEGHTDARGTEDHNMELSRRRAAAVIAHLDSRGVDTSRIAPRAFGPSRPRTADPFDPSNRRVEARISD